MAGYKKRRARELKHDKFRDTTITFFDKLGDALAGKGKSILYGILALIGLGLLVSLWNWRSEKKTQEAERALGRAIEINQAPVTASPSPGSTSPTFSTEQARAQKAVEEFQKVAQKYGSNPYHDLSRYFIATNLVTTDHDKGVAELQSLSNSSDNSVAALAKFALAQAKESDGKLDEAAALYAELAKQNSALITADTANLQLAKLYVKEGKKQEAADIFFNIVDQARNKKGADGKPVPETSAAREAAPQLQKIDPARYAQLPPEPPPAGMPF